MHLLRGTLRLSDFAVKLFSPSTQQTRAKATTLAPLHHQTEQSFKKTTPSKSNPPTPLVSEL
jgi:hypothetical protein